MSIILDSVNMFLSALKTNIYSNTKSGLIESYSLLQQETNNRLSITSYLKNGGWLKRIIISEQTMVGVTYLISNDSLEDIVSRFKESKRGCYLYQNDNGLSFSTFYGYQGSEPNIYDTILIKQYHGSISEFGPALFNSNTIVKVPDDKLANVLSRLKAYGEYTSSSRPVLLVGDCEQQTLTFYANQTEGRNFICQVSINCFVSEDFTFIIDGQDITSLLAIFDKVNIESETTINLDLDSNYITLSNALGSVSINLLDIQLNLTCKKWTDFFDIIIKDIYGNRIVDLVRFKEALTAQQPNKTYNNKSLKISSEDLNLIITKVGDPAGIDYSLVDIVDVSSLDSPWTDLAYNSTCLKKAIDTVSKGKLIDEKVPASLSITLVKNISKIKTKSIVRWIALFVSKGLEDDGITTVVSTIANVPDSIEV